ncbi:MAG: Trans-aconitate 2-methyltransferase [Anaerolineae bacterium]|nr:Trans-aconitate 2-methyltransferase [Anaerolineae bacterium]
MFKSITSVLTTTYVKPETRRNAITNIISTYSGKVKWYAAIRFRIIRLDFLEEIEQYLPDEGEVLDLGCGFGLFALYMATCRPHIRVIGVDINRERIAIAENSAKKLGLGNIRFITEDLTAWKPEQKVTAAYSLDVFHHIPLSAGNRLILDLFQHLEPGGKFLLKDIDAADKPQLLFTYLLDLLMSPRDPYSYRTAAAWQEQLRATGFSPVYLHRMRDILPYPHIFFISSKPG